MATSTPALPRAESVRGETDLVLPLARTNTAGAKTTGGIDGTAVHVTTLASDGPGSLRQAVVGEGARLVVFDVAGVIDLRGRSIWVRHPDLTIAGQTAPEPGITLIRGGLIVETHDVVIQHLAVRPGDFSPDRPAGEWAPDALGVRRGAEPVHDVIFDHCSATWAVDENLSTSGPRDVDSERDPDVTARRITLRNCLIAEALSNSTHPKGEHSKGTLVHDGVRDVAITGCLYAHNRERNPRLKGGTSTVLEANVMYNWGSACVGVGARGNERLLQPAEAVLDNNVAIAGLDTRSRILVKSVDPGGRVLLRANAAIDATGRAMKQSDEKVALMTEAPPWAPAFRESSPWTTISGVLRGAGSRPARRDAIDARIVASVIRGDGRIIDSQAAVGGYPVREPTRRVLEVPTTSDARRSWLDSLSSELSEDRTLDLEPLRTRLGM